MGRLLRHGQDSQDRKSAALCRELSKWWPALWTFARVEGVEPTNNVAERALRPAVLWRKGSFGSESAAGSWFAERLLTVAATCRQQGRHLLDIEVRSGDGRNDRLPALATELVDLGVEVMVTGGPYALEAARNATATIPI